MKNLILNLANYVHDCLTQKPFNIQRTVSGYARNGDAQFHLDDIAESAIRDYIKRHAISIALLTEEGKLEIYGKNPEYLFLIDPIDGSRPASANLEMATLSIAVAPYIQNPTINDIEYALIKEIKSGAYLYTDRYTSHIESFGYFHTLPQLSVTAELDYMFWSIEFNGHPADLMIKSYGHLIDKSANKGGIFVFNSASYSITRIITGQLDAYVDIGNRLLKDNPQLLSQFQRVGNGKILHLFPYDIAAAVILAKKAGVVITDAYGKDLGDTLLLNCSPSNQQSCIAASNASLHHQLLKHIKWRNKI